MFFSLIILWGRGCPCFLFMQKKIKFSILCAHFDTNFRIIVNYVIFSQGSVFFYTFSAWMEIHSLLLFRTTCPFCHYENIPFHFLMGLQYVCPQLPLSGLYKDIQI